MWHRPTLLLALLLSPLAHAQEDSAPDTSREPYAEDLRDLLSARSHGMGGAGAPLGWGRGRHGQPRASPPSAPTASS